MLLPLQILIGLTVAVELTMLVAAEIPLVIRGRRAFLWFGILVGVLIALSVAAAWAGDFEVSEIVAHAPRAAGVTLTVAMMLAWTLFAFSAGYLILQLEQSRDATVWAKAQLEGSEEMLSGAARIGERLRISRELHDTVGHHLTGLSLNLEIASQVTNEAALVPVQRSQLIAKMLLAEIRETLNTMRSDRAVDLAAALEQLRGGLRRPVCHLTAALDPPPGPAAAQALFRCVQEAMTNAARHANAANLWVTIERRGERIVFEARDDGKGAAHIIAGNGLRGMRERLSELGGDLEFESAPGRGFHLRGWIPAEGEPV